MWSSKLFRRVFLAFTLLIVVSALSFSIVVSHEQEFQLRAQLRERLRVASVMLGQVAVESLTVSADRDPDAVPRPTPAELQQLVRRLGAQTRTRLTVMTLDGIVLADSAKAEVTDVQQMDNHRRRPEVDLALRQGTGFDERYSTTLGERLVYHALRVDRDGIPRGVVRAAVPVQSIERQVRQGRQTVGLFAIILVGVAIAGATYLLARTDQSAPDPDPRRGTDGRRKSWSTRVHCQSR